jgi:hypothetical protein
VLAVIKTALLFYHIEYLTKKCGKATQDTLPKIPGREKSMLKQEIAGLKKCKCGDCIKRGKDAFKNAG